MTDEEALAMEEALTAAREEVRLHLSTIGARDERIGEMEAEVGRLKTELEAEVERLKTELEVEVEGSKKELDTLRQQLSAAVDRYRTLALVSFPEVDEQMVGGGTVEEIDSSLAAAQKLVQRVKERLEAKLAQERVPAGAPPRTLPDLSGLSPGEKIAYALSGR